MSQIKVINVIHPSGSTNNIVNDASGNATIGNNLTVTGGLVPSSSFLRNRIINGAMVIDQRNAGAAVTGSGNYPVDRFFVSNTTGGTFSVQQVSTAPTGFSNSMKFTTTAASGSLSATQIMTFRQYIEGYNVADLAWGTANAKTVTLSFQVRSSLTGTFGGSLFNAAGDRSYPFNYTISAADTWTSISITIPGDTSGTWNTTNGIGLIVIFGLGVGSTYSGTAGSWAGALYVSSTSATSVIGTLNATWYITGVQLEVGSVATPFERRQYGQELALCQRYYWRQASNGAVFSRFGFGTGTSASVAQITLQSPVPMRDRPTVFDYNVLATYDGATVLTVNSATIDVSGVLVTSVNVNVGSGITQYRPYFLIGNNSSSAYVGFGAEL